MECEGRVGRPVEERKRGREERKRRKGGGERKEKLLIRLVTKGKRKEEGGKEGKVCFSQVGCIYSTGRQMGGRMYRFWIHLLGTFG